jgi:hypothetical protein
MARPEDFAEQPGVRSAMNLKALIRNAAIACIAVHWTAYTAETTTNVEFVASGMEEHVGRPNDRVALTIYQGDATQALRKVDLSFRNAVKRLSLPGDGTYRVSFESNEPDEEGATSCAATAQLQVRSEQSYRVAFTLLKQTCALSVGRIDAAGTYEEIVSADGKMRRLKAKK